MKKAKAAGMHHRLPSGKFDEKLAEYDSALDESMQKKYMKRQQNQYNRAKAGHEDGAASTTYNPDERVSYRLRHN